MTASILRRVGARLDAEFLNVLEACLQLERRRHLAVQVAGRGVDDRGTLDAVVPNRVLLDRPAREADVLPCSSSSVLGTWSLKQELRHLASVHREIVDFPLAQIHADSGGTQIQNRGGTGDGDVLRNACGLDLKIECELLANGKRDAGVLDRSETSLIGFDGVVRGLHVADQEGASLVRHGSPFLAGTFVLHRDFCTGDERVGLVADDSADFALVGLGQASRGKQCDQSRGRDPSIKGHLSSLKRIPGRIEGGVND
jgi:hypothetical protein